MLLAARPPHPQQTLELPPASPVYMGWWGVGADDGDGPMDAVCELMDWLDTKTGKEPGTCNEASNRSEHGAGLAPEVYINSISSSYCVCIQHNVHVVMCLHVA